MSRAGCTWVGRGPGWTGGLGGQTGQGPPAMGSSVCFPAPTWRELESPSHLPCQALCGSGFRLWLPKRQPSSRRRAALSCCTRGISGRDPCAVATQGPGLWAPRGQDLVLRPFRCCLAGKEEEREGTRRDATGKGLECPQDPVAPQAPEHIRCGGTTSSRPSLWVQRGVVFLHLPYCEAFVKLGGPSQIID